MQRIDPRAGTGDSSREPFHHMGWQLLLLGRCQVAIGAHFGSCGSCGRPAHHGMPHGMTCLGKGEVGERPRVSRHGTGWASLACLRHLLGGTPARPTAMQKRTWPRQRQGNMRQAFLLVHDPTTAPHALLTPASRIQKPSAPSRAKPASIDQLARRFWLAFAG